MLTAVSERVPPESVEFAGRGKIHLQTADVRIVERLLVIALHLDEAGLHQLLHMLRDRRLRVIESPDEIAVANVDPVRVPDHNIIEELDADRMG